MRSLVSGRVLALLFAVALLAPPAALAQSGPYEIAQKTIAALEARGDLDGVTRVIDVLTPDFPEDVPLALQLAWAKFRLGHFTGAEAAYRRVLVLAPSSVDGRRGLGWSLLRQSRCHEARTYFDDVLATVPEQASAKEGLSACTEGPRVRYFPSLWLSGQYNTANPKKELGIAAYASLGLEIVDHWSLAAAFRFVDVAPPGKLSQGAAQYEAYAQVGYHRPRFGVSLHYAFVADQTGFSGDSHHVGAVGRYSYWGDGVLEVDGSFYTDANVLRAQLGYRIPLPHGFSLRPAAQVQWASTKLYGNGALGNGALTLSWDHARGGVFVSGKVGEEFRPAELSQDTVWDLPDRISWGLRVGGHVEWKRAILAVQYEYDRLRDANTTPSTNRDAHFIALGVTLKLPR
jgi:tetratricopeptide (TPR) repeat protein